MGKPNFTMPGQGMTITLPTGKAFIVLATILITGTVGCLAMILAAVIAVAYLLNLAVIAVVELIAHLADVYMHADSFTKVICWILVVFLLSKVWPRIRQSFLKSLSAQSLSAS